MCNPTKFTYPKTFSNIATTTTSHLQEQQKSPKQQQPTTTTPEATDADHQYHQRPDILIPPRGIGPVPVTDFNENDVLCGRGGRINGHAGNIQFRRICATKQDQYLSGDVKKIEKAYIAASVVQEIRRLGGRFLKQDGKTGQWYDIGCARAATKAGQVIREHNPTTKKNQMIMIQQQQRLEVEQQLPLPFFNGGSLYPNYPMLPTPQNQQQQQKQVEHANMDAKISSAEDQTSCQPTPIDDQPMSIDNGAEEEEEPMANGDEVIEEEEEEALRNLMKDRRLSALSLASSTAPFGPKRLSLVMLMRESIRSSFQFGTTTRDSFLMDMMMVEDNDDDDDDKARMMRQSILSDISDCCGMLRRRSSIMELEVEGYQWNNQKEGTQSARPSWRIPRPSTTTKRNDTTRRQRKSSLWSMASTISRLSISSEISAISSDDSD